MKKVTPEMKLELEGYKEVTEKVERLAEKLEEAKSLADEIASTELTVTITS